MIFEDKNKEQKGREYAFLMLGYEMPKIIKEIQNRIPNEIVYTDSERPHMYGKEMEPHVTIVPCLSNSTKLDDIKGYLRPISDYMAYIKGISLFNNELYDVLKCDIVCKPLHDTNKSILKDFESYSEFKDNYQPHLTIAYLNKGQGTEYVKDFDKLIQIEPTVFSYSWIEDGKEKKTTFEK